MQLQYKNRLELVSGRNMYCGVLQGSVLGSHLWNLACDRVLRTALPPGCRIVCYADDTLVIARGGDWRQARDAANDALRAVVHFIQAMGLEVAPHKTEALFFYDRARGDHPPPKYGWGMSASGWGPT